MKGDPYVNLFALVLLFSTSLALLPPPASGVVPDALFNALPSPMNFLEKSDQAGIGVEAGLLQVLASECPRLKKLPALARQQGCDLVGLKARFTTLLSQLQAGQSGLRATAFATKKPWDLSALISGNFLFVPTAAGETEGRDLMLDLFLTRDQIVSAVDRLYAHAKKISTKPVSPELTMMGPFMRAYFLTSTPLGALSETFHSIRCGVKDTSCELEKQIWGGVCHLAVEQNQTAFTSLETRFKIFAEDETSPEMARTKQIAALAEFIEQGQLDRATLSAKISDLESGGPGTNASEDYVALTVSVLTYFELKQLMALKYNCLAYSDDFSAKIKNSFTKRLAKLSTQSLKQIETALTTYGLTHELGGSL